MGSPPDGNDDEEEEEEEHQSSHNEVENLINILPTPINGSFSDQLVYNLS